MRSSNKLKTISSESPSSNSKSKLQASFSLKRLNTIVTEKLAQGYKYDKMLFHKTIFHLRPLGDNPELFTREISLTSQVMSALKYKQANHSKAVLPHPVTVKFGLDRVHGRSKMLRDDTLSHITAKKWLIYNMESGMIVKGYKYRQPHDVASLSKLLTFYTAYDIIR
jgi:D-alanyl-D-alanine carboxypeptidase